MVYAWKVFCNPVLIDIFQQKDHILALLGLHDLDIIQLDIIKIMSGKSHKNNYTLVGVTLTDGRYILIGI